MKGWYRDNYRHSLAAKGIKTRKISFSLRSLSKAWSVGAAEAETRAKERTKMIKEPSVPSVKYAELTPDEKEQAAFLSLRAALRPRERRISVIQMMIQEYLPKRDSESWDEYRMRVKDWLMKGGVDLNLMAFGGEDYQFIKRSGGEVISRKGPMTISEFIDRMYQDAPDVLISPEAAISELSSKKRTSEEETTLRRAKKSSGFDEDDDGQEVSEQSGEEQNYNPEELASPSARHWYAEEFSDDEENQFSEWTE